MVIIQESAHNWVSFEGAKGPFEAKSGQETQSRHRSVKVVDRPSVNSRNGAYSSSGAKISRETSNGTKTTTRSSSGTRSGRSVEDRRGRRDSRPRSSSVSRRKERTSDASKSDSLSKRSRRTTGSDYHSTTQDNSLTREESLIRTRQRSQSRSRHTSRSTASGPNGNPPPRSRTAYTSSTGRALPVPRSEKAREGATGVNAARARSLPTEKSENARVGIPSGDNRARPKSRTREAYKASSTSRSHSNPRATTITNADVNNNARSTSRGRPKAVLASDALRADENRSRSRSRPTLNDPSTNNISANIPSVSNSRGRSASRSRSKVEAAPVRPRSASLSRPSTGSESRGRVRDRSRPPSTKQLREIQRRRSRSASLTRVTGPRPPSTLRTRQELRTSTSRSIGPGINPKSTRSMSEDDSTAACDTKIGRNISFSDCRKDDTLDKKSTHGILVKLFGDKVEQKSTVAGLVGMEIRPRILLAATIYHNTATNLWITTINTNQRGVVKNPTLANKHLKAFSFQTEREARECAIANAPPKMLPQEEFSGCFICKGKFAVFRRSSHCRNCGVCVCNNCSTTWSSKFLPDTYNLKTEKNLRVCDSCDNLSASFKGALQQGDYEEAIALYGTGNVNLRTPFPPSGKKDEVMYPIHCAVEGGNMEIVKWLINDHYCPIKSAKPSGAKKGKAPKDALIQTSKGRSVLSISIDCLKVDIMHYLVVDCGISIYDANSLQSSLRALEATLMTLPRQYREKSRSVGDEASLGQWDGNASEEVSVARWDRASFDDISEPSSLGESLPVVVADDNRSISGRSNRTKGSSKNNDACIICFDRKINCVATPCGHQICCLECSRNLSACPVCNNRGDFIKIFRP